MNKPKATADEQLAQLTGLVERYERLSYNAGVVFFNVHLETGVISANRLWRERWNVSEDETITFGQFKERISDKFIQFFEQSFSKIKNDKTPVETVIQASPLLGEIWQRFRFDPVLDNEGNLVSIDISNVDITQEISNQRRLESALEKAKKYEIDLEMATRAGRVGLYSHNLTRDININNSVARELMELPEEEFPEVNLDAVLQRYVPSEHEDIKKVF